MIRCASLGRIVLAIIMFNLVATPVLAQVPVGLPDAEGTTLTWVIALGIIIVTGLSSFLNPKRTHMT